MDPHDIGQRTMKEVQIVMELFKTKSSEAVKKEADEKNAESAIDYALRSVSDIFQTVLSNLTLIHIPAFNSALTAPKAVFSVTSISLYLCPF
jgi:hypothetical protein